MVSRPLLLCHATNLGNSCATPQASETALQLDMHERYNLSLSPLFAEQPVEVDEQEASKQDSRGSLEPGELCSEEHGGTTAWEMKREKEGG